MKIAVTVVLSVLGVALTGCGGGDGDADLAPAPAPQVAPPVSAVAPAPAVNAPPTGSAPAAIDTAPDPFESVKVSRDGSPNKTDLETLQAIVDGYSFGIDGLGAPPISGLEELVAKGFLKKIPAPPEGKKWAYDSAKWKVSLVDK